MKLFTLISKDQVYLSKEKKIFSADEFSTLLEGSELLTRIQQDVEEYRQNIGKECELLKEQAEKVGFEEGLKKWTTQLIQLQKIFDAKQQELEQAIVQISLAAAKKIIGREIEISPQALGEIIANQLKTFSHCRKIHIIVNQADLKTLEECRPQLKAVIDHLESLTIKERDDIEKGGFIIETEGGIINLSSPEKQWKPIEAMFEAFMQSKDDKDSDKKA
ncbi:MAG: sctL [Chlamydiales bacterium]|jgi:type III secretion protein L|nr:sctL [Chlamydiales bacterium]